MKRKQIEIVHFNYDIDLMNKIPPFTIALAPVGLYQFLKGISVLITRDPELFSGILGFAFRQSNHGVKLL